MTSATVALPLEVLTLDLQGETFAIEAVRVREILDLVPITEVPGAPSFASGLINMRGRVIPLADLRLKLGMAPTPPTIDSRIVVLDIELEGEPITVGMIADKVNEVTELAAATVEDAPRIGLQWRPEFIRCIGKRTGNFIIVLNVEAIFEHSLTEQFGGAAARPSGHSAA